MKIVILKYTVFTLKVAFFMEMETTNPFTVNAHYLDSQVTKATVKTKVFLYMVKGGRERVVVNAHYLDSQVTKATVI